MTASSGSLHFALCKEGEPTRPNVQPRQAPPPPAPGRSRFNPDPAGSHTEHWGRGVVPDYGEPILEQP